MKNAYRVSTEQHGNMNRASCNPKTQHLASSVFYCTVLLEHVNDQLSPQTRKFDRFARFCGCNCKTSNI